eukprot:COSAG02_NODE_3088_length_7390_cov_44.560280_2_plen_70_part_00
MVVVVVVVVVLLLLLLLLVLPLLLLLLPPLPLSPLLRCGDDELGRVTARESDGASDRDAGAAGVWQWTL